MSPEGTCHATAIRRTDRVLSKLLGEAAIQIQLPIRLNNNSEPEPDIAVVKIDPSDYADHHPTPSEVYLVVEIADTTLKIDCDIKAKIYAKAKITEY
jgi:Uma2 family endonuclease